MHKLRAFLAIATLLFAAACEGVVTFPSAPPTLSPPGPRPVEAYSGHFVIWLESIAFCDTLGGMDTETIRVPLWVMNTKVSPHALGLGYWIHSVAYNPLVVYPDSTTPFEVDSTWAAAPYSVTGDFNLDLPWTATCSGTGENFVWQGAAAAGNPIPLPYGEMVHLGDYIFHYWEAPPNGAGTVTYVTTDCRRQFMGGLYATEFSTTLAVSPWTAAGFYGYGAPNAVLINSCIRLGDTANCKAPVCPGATRWSPCSRCPPELEP